MRFWSIYSLVQASFFGGLLYGFLVGVFFIFPCRPAMVADIFTQSPPRHHKKASYDPALT